MATAYALLRSYFLVTALPLQARQSRLLLSTCSSPLMTLPGGRSFNVSPHLCSIPQQANLLQLPLNANTSCTESPSCALAPNQGPVGPGTRTCAPACLPLPVLTPFAIGAQTGPLPSCPCPTASLLLEGWCAPLNKPNKGGICPILLFEAPLKLATGCTFHKVNPTFAHRLLPSQFGCGLSAGAELLLRTAQTCADALPGHAFVASDVSNAFGTLRRSSAFQACIKRTPGLCPILAHVAPWSHARLDSRGPRRMAPLPC